MRAAAHFWGEQLLPSLDAELNVSLSVAGCRSCELQLMCRACMTFIIGSCPSLWMLTRVELQECRADLMCRVAVVDICKGPEM